VPEAAPPVEAIVLAMTLFLLWFFLGILFSPRGSQREAKTRAFFSKAVLFSDGVVYMNNEA